jgi:hypothetical protein
LEKLDSFVAFQKYKKTLYEVEDIFLVLGIHRKIFYKSDITMLDKFRRKLIAAAIADLN